MGISAAKVHEIFVSDTKLNISPYYFRPGGAFGGSCLPKDVRALQHISAECGANTPLIDSLLRSNEAHKFCLFQRVVQGLPPKAKILIAGIAFKAGQRRLARKPQRRPGPRLLREGFRVSICDPALMPPSSSAPISATRLRASPRWQSSSSPRSGPKRQRFDRVVAANATVNGLVLAPEQDIVDLGTLP